METISKPAKPREFRRELYRVKKALTAQADSWQPKSYPTCTWSRHDEGGVRVMRREVEGAQLASFRGLVTCKHRCCPVCETRRRVKVADELKAVSAAQRDAGRVPYMLTLTVRHQMGDDLREMRKGIARAWSYMRKQPEWKPLAGATCARGLEVTHGGNGWHPHLHVILWLEPLGDERRPLPRIANDERDLWEPSELDQLANNLSAAWEYSVQRKLGATFLPTRTRGLRLHPTDAAEYISKLGLSNQRLAFELSDPNRKKGRGGNRTPFQLMQDAANGDDTARALVAAYARGMKGAHVIDWSHITKAERQAAVEAVERDQPPDELAVFFSAGDWDELRCISVDARERILEACEEPDPLWGVYRWLIDEDERELAESIVVETCWHRGDA
jgi:hypothetical protein